jgi:hypothetical protein
MRVQHYLFGYDKEGAALRVELPIRPDLLDDVKRLVGAGEDDPDMLDPYPLTAMEAEAVARTIGATLERLAHEWFIQAFAVEDAASPTVERSSLTA